MVNFNELKSLEKDFVKEKKFFLDKVKSIKEDKKKHLEEAKAELRNLKSKLVVSEKELENIFKALANFNLQIEKLFKQNIEHKRQIIDLKRLRARIPDQIKDMKRAIKSNLRLIEAIRDDAKKIALRKTQYMHIVEDLNKVIDRYDGLVKNMTAEVKELATKEKNLVEGKIIWAEKSALEDLGRFIRKFIMPHPAIKHTKSAKKK